MATASGALLAASFPSPSYYPIAFVALVPLLLAARGRTGPHGLLAGWLVGLGFYAAAWWWVLPAIARFQQWHPLSAAPVFVVFAAYHALQFAFFGALAATLPPARHGRAAVNTCLLLAASWTLLEWAFPRVIPCYLGDTLAPSPLLRQAADLGGTYLLSFLVVLVNACVAAAIDGRHDPRRSAPLLAAAAMTLATLAGYGAIRLHNLDRALSSSADKRRSVTVAIVQGAIESGRTDLDAANEDAWNTYETLTRSMYAKAPEGTEVQLVIWPETTLRTYLRQNVEYRRRVAALTRELETPLLVGALDWEPRRRRELNSAYLFINITDDGWFGDTPAPHQHLNATILRAVETRRWLVRASNSGISALVNPKGDLVARLPLGQTGFLIDAAGTSGDDTAYVRLGNWPIPMSLAIFVVASWRDRCSASRRRARP